MKQTIICSCLVVSTIMVGSGSVVRLLDLWPRGHGFEPHRRRCVVSLSKTLLS